VNYKKQRNIKETLETVPGKKGQPQTTEVVGGKGPEGTWRGGGVRKEVGVCYRASPKEIKRGAPHNRKENQGKRWGGRV